MPMQVNRIPNYSTKLFTDVWSEYEDFASDLGETPFSGAISEDSLNILYYLLYARYGNSPIANRDVNQFKFKVFSVIFQYGPTWEKRLDIQKSLRNLTEADLAEGSKTIINHAYNPSATPGTSALDELQYINDQNTSNLKRGKLEGLSTLWSLLETDVTEQFLMRFEPCFKQFVYHEKPTIFVEEEIEEGEEL